MTIYYKTPHFFRYNTCIMLIQGCHKDVPVGSNAFLAIKKLRTLFVMCNKTKIDNLKLDTVSEEFK